MRSSDSLTLPSGLGDGYYPVYANHNFGLWPQSVVVDFKVWETRRYMLLPGQSLDEYGLVTGSVAAPSDEELRQRSEAVLNSPEMRAITAKIQKIKRVFALCELVGFDHKALPPECGDRLGDPAAVMALIDRYRDEPTEENAEAARSGIVAYVRGLPADRNAVEAWEAELGRRELSEVLR